MFNQTGGEAAGNRVEKRSVRIANHRTSVSLESAFWEELKRLARIRVISLNQLIREVDARRSGNLSSALRLFVLEAVKREGREP